MIQVCFATDWGVNRSLPVNSAVNSPFALEGHQREPDIVHSPVGEELLDGIAHHIGELLRCACWLANNPVQISRGLRGVLLCSTYELSIFAGNLVRVS